MSAVKKNRLAFARAETLRIADVRMPLVARAVMRDHQEKSGRREGFPLPRGGLQFRAKRVSKEWVST